MKKQTYAILKNSKFEEITELDYDKLQGLRFKPINNAKYPGVKVTKFMMINPSFIERVLKRKIKKKLEIYLRFIISIIDDEDESTDVTDLRSALNDLTRYRDIVKYKYEKFLEEKYTILLLKKIDLLEQELKSKIFYYKEPEKVFDEEKEFEEPKRSR